MSTSTCLHCGTPTAGAHLCEKHTRTLLVALRHVAEYHPELDVLATRQARMGDPGKGSIGKSQPLPVDGRFVDTGRAGGGARQAPGSVLRDAVRTMLVGWCRIVAEEHPPVLGPRHVACLDASCHVVRRSQDSPLRDSVPAMCAYLDRQHRTVLASPWVAELLVDLLDAENQLRRVIDRPPERWYAGVCSARLLRVDEHGAVVDDGECPVDLYAVEDEGTVTCPACGTTYSVDQRRAIMLEAADAELVTAAEAAGALVQWGGLQADETKVATRIRVWVHRKRLLAKGQRQVGHDADGQPRMRPTYRLSDVRELLEEHARHTRSKR